MEKIVIDRELCKGCGLCIRVCPQQVLKASSEINSKGYHPAECTNQEKCISCASCAIVCPDVAITIYADKAEV